MTALGGGADLRHFDRVVRRHEPAAHRGNRPPARRGARPPAPGAFVAQSFTGWPNARGPAAGARRRTTRSTRARPSAQREIAGRDPPPRARGARRRRRSRGSCCATARFYGPGRVDGERVRAADPRAQAAGRRRRRRRLVVPAHRRRRRGDRRRARARPPRRLQRRRRRAGAGRRMAPVPGASGSARGRRGACRSGSARLAAGEVGGLADDADPRLVEREGEAGARLAARAGRAGARDSGTAPTA